jgi:AbiV family abortive infection protein
LDNAVELMRDASGLAAFRCYARAFSLGILAAEEYGKHMMAMGMLGKDADDSAAWAEFWQRFKSHQPKYENMLRWVVSTGLDAEHAAEFMKQFQQHVRADQGRKMAGFYVDIKDGEVVAPTEAVSEDEAETVLAIFGDVIRALADGYRGFDFVAGFVDSESEARKVQAALKARDGDRLGELFEQAHARHDAGEPTPEAID